MDNQKSLDDMLNELEGYESSIDHATLAKNKLKKAFEEYKSFDKQIIFEVMGSSCLPMRSGGNINFIGMEDVALRGFHYTSKGNIVCLFGYSERQDDICIQEKWLENVFGRPGAELANWVRNNGEIRAAIEEFKRSRQVGGAVISYKDKDYGAW